MARLTTQTALPMTSLDTYENDGEEMVLNAHPTLASPAIDSSTTRDPDKGACFDSESSDNNTKSSTSREVGLITPLDSDESFGESIGSATENSNGLNSNNSRSQSTGGGSKASPLSSPRNSESSNDWDNKWNFTAPVITTTTSISSPTANKTPRSSNSSKQQHVFGTWDNRCGSPVKVSCDFNWEDTTASTTADRTSPRSRIRKLNESSPRPRNEEIPSSPITMPCRTSSPFDDASVCSPKTVIDKSPTHNGRSDFSNARAESSTTSNPPSHRRPRTRRLKSDITTTAWSATMDRSPRVTPRHHSVDACTITGSSDINSKSNNTRTQPIRNWSIFDQSGHFCTCTACATVVLQTSLQEDEFYTHQQRRCCRGPFEKEIAELIADMKQFGYDDERQHDEHNSDTNYRGYRGDALVMLASPLRELALLCRDVRNIHAIRLFGGVQAVVGAMNVLRKQAHEHLQRRRKQKQYRKAASATITTVDGDECYSKALRDGCSILQYVAREYAESNSSSSSPGTFAHRISLVMLLSGGGGVGSANSNSGVQGIVQAMKLFPLDYSLQRTGIRALMNMSNSSRDACQAILDASFSNGNDPGTKGGHECEYSGIVEELIAVLENFPHCPSIKESAIVTLCNLFEKVPDAAMKQLAPRHDTAQSVQHVQVANVTPEQRSKPSNVSNGVATVADDCGLSTSKHPPTEISAESCSHSTGEISSMTTCTAARTETTQSATRMPKERTVSTTPPPPVSPRAVVKLEDITQVLDGVLRLGPKRHYHDENNTATRSDGDDDDVDDVASALWNRVYRLEQRLLIGEVLETVFHGHRRLYFEEKKCNM
jgi:hypothetical protein